MSKPMTWSKPASAAVFAMPTMPPAGPERIASLPRNGGGVGEPAVRLHEEQARRAPPQPRHHLVDIAPQHRRQIGVDHRGVAAADQLDQRLDLVARRDLGEADLARHGGQRRLVRGPAPAVHQHDGERAIARGRTPPAARRAPPRVERAQHLALGGHPLVDLDRPGRRAARAARSGARRCRAAPGSRSAARRRGRR